MKLTPERKKELEAFRDELAEELKGRFASADHYYYTKNLYRSTCATLAGMTERQFDPVGVWHGMQSN